MFRRLAPLAALLLAACASAAPPPAPAPVAASPPLGRGMVAAANPLAAEAGAKVLRAGGSAIDAAVAVQAVLGLVEPQSSGLGGGGFITYYDAATRKVTAYDGRETAPKGASPAMFLDAAGKPLDFRTAWRSGRSTGAPGAVAVLALAQREHGKLPWRDLFGEAERIGREGFIITPRLAELLDGPMAMIETPDLQAYFTRPLGTPMKAGDRLRNTAYADTVRRLADEGPSALYAGAIPAAIEAKVHAEPLPGTLTAADIAAYRPKVVEPLCRPYRVYVVCVPPPPSGGVGLLLGLALLERTDIAARGPSDPQAWVLLGQAERLMYADRDRYVGDPAFVEVPTAGLLEPAYVASRAALIAPGAPPPGAGTPPGAGVRAPDATREPGGTSHFVVVDAAGNAVSMTTTVESGFGSGRMVAGFLLNNQLTDFSFSPTERDGVAAANAVAPGKRPRSSMAPAIVLDRDGRLVMAVGSPGGNAILAYNLKAIVGVLDWKLSMQEAVALPNLIARGANVTGEAEKFSPQILAALAAQGMAVKPGGGEGSGLHGIIVRPTGLEGGADPRREGVAIAP